MTTGGETLSARSVDAGVRWSEGGLGKRRRAPRLLFGQVREDAAVEAHVLASHPRPERAFAIASGGCTAFSLLAARPVELVAVDINPAQIHLCHLKRAALLGLPHDDAVSAITRDATHAYRAVRDTLPRETQAFWDDRAHLLRAGLARSGVIDAALRRAMLLFRVFIHRRATIERLLGAPTLDEQASFYRSRFDSRILRAAIGLALSRPLLRIVYGGAALRDLPPDFSAQMKRQLDDVFLRFPASENGYLWQLFLDRYPESRAALPLYLREENAAEVRAGLARTTLVCGEASEVLSARPASFDFLALSNILEVSTREGATSLLASARRASRPGALVCLRSIFPPRPFVAQAIAQAGFTPREDLSARAMDADTSPFCRHITVIQAPD